MVSDENRPLIAPAGDEGALGRSLELLASDAALRASLGKANRAEARARYDEKTMIDAYRRLYARAMGRSALT
jgi:glycosyltransferase involved in cell wall biosynthesis